MNEIIQGTDAWFAQRLGKVTSSKLADVIAKTKSGPSTSRANYMAQLICERLTGRREESYTNAAMEWGTATEPAARMAYEATTGNMVQEVGFVLHPVIGGFGGSPDGLIDDNGMVEIKCPNTATHIEWLRGKKVPTKHKAQIQGLMECCKRDWCDFISYDPRLPEHLQLFVVREKYDAEYCAMLTEEVRAFLSELDKMEIELAAPLKIAA